MNQAKLTTILHAAGVDPAHAATFAPVLAKAFGLPTDDGTSCVIGQGTWSDENICRFLANALNETGCLTVLVENLYYTTPGRLLQIFPSAFSNRLPDPYLRNPQGLANLVYDSRRGFANSRYLGNNQDGDGFKFRGRGLFQTTGRAGYTAFASVTGLDVVNNPDLIVANTESMVDSAIKFWDGHKLGDYEVVGSLADVRKVIGGSLVGLPEVTHYYNLLKGAL